MKKRFNDIIGEKIDRPGCASLYDYLESTDFFTAPASSAHHLSYEGGLLEHSLNVYAVLEKRASEWCPEISEESLAICGLFHDLAKINQYKKIVKSRKQTDKEGRTLLDHRGKPLWEDYDTWESSPSYCPMGHGEKSVWLINQHIKLTEIEVLAIRWHMGSWTPGVITDFQTGQIYNEARKKSPLVIALHLADMEATHIIERGK